MSGFGIGIGIGVNPSCAGMEAGAIPTGSELIADNLADGELIDDNLVDFALVDD